MLNNVGARLHNFELRDENSFIWIKTFYFHIFSLSRSFSLFLLYLLLLSPSTPFFFSLFPLSRFSLSLSLSLSLPLTYSCSVFFIPGKHHSQPCFSIWDMVPKVKNKRVCFLVFRAFVLWAGFANLILFDAEIELTLKSNENKSCFLDVLHIIYFKHKVCFLNLKSHMKTIRKSLMIRILKDNLQGMLNCYKAAKASQKQFL